MFDPSETQSASILIVDEQQADAAQLAHMLRGAGYGNVSSTGNPFAVRAMHETNKYDLILLELRMPQMDGFQIMESLKNVEGDGYLSVLAISDLPADILRALKAGAKDFLGKPFDPAEVLARVHNLLEVRILHRKLEQFDDTPERTVREKTTALRESEARFKSFTERYPQVSGEPMFGLGSRFVGYCGIGMDITGRMTRQK